MSGVTHSALSRICEQWKADASVLRTYGAEQQAAAIEQCLEHLKLAITEAAEETVSMKEAVEASGYTTRQLGRMISEGKLENVGTKHRPRFRRGCLPMKSKNAKAGGLAFGQRVEIARSLLNQ